MTININQRCKNLADVLGQLDDAIGLVQRVLVHPIESTKTNVIANKNAREAETNVPGYIKQARRLWKNLSTQTGAKDEIIKWTKPEWDDQSSLIHLVTEDNLITQPIGIELLTAMLDFGFSSNAENHWRQTLLMKAVYSPKAVQILLDRGADVHKADFKPRDFGSYKPPLSMFDCQYRTALAHTAEHSEYEWRKPALLQSAQLLLDHGAKVDGAWPVAKTTPLLRAISNGFLELAQLFVQHGADLSAVFDGQNAVMLAAQGGHFDLVKMLVEEFNAPTGIEEQVRDAEMMARAQGHNEMADYLLEKKASMLENDPALGMVPRVSAGRIQIMGAEELLNLCFRSEWKSVYAALESGANPNAVLHKSGDRINADYDYFKKFNFEVFPPERRLTVTPLLCALWLCGAGKAIGEDSGYEVIQRLVELGADVNFQPHNSAPRPFYEPPLVAASRLGLGYKIVPYLLERQANPNQTDDRGHPPLYVAQVASFMTRDSTWHDTICSALIKAGASLLMPDGQRSVADAAFAAVQKETKGLSADDIQECRSRGYLKKAGWSLPENGDWTPPAP